MKEMTNLAIPHPTSIENWQESLSDLITNPNELLAIAKLDPENSRFSELATQDFPLKVPRQFAALIRPGDWNDPILAQIWPTFDETSNSSSHSYDPLKETKFTPETGLLHKYKNRVLLITAPHCAINCRYCFRRHFDYQTNSPSQIEWEHTFKYIHRNKDIEEVIFSGGDPLALSDRRLNWLISQIEDISHVTTLRVHTRLPIVIPQRVTSKILEKFKSTRLKIVLVTHCNHANELTQKTQNAFTKLREVGVLLLNQSVLLAGINDDALILAALSKKLFSQNILPYYLHMPDAVQGTQHFAVTERAALKVMDDLRSLLSGYLVPTLVREDPGAPSKTRI
jgi:EF-P beta-lysylation protein EpmB